MGAFKDTVNRFGSMQEVHATAETQKLSHGLVISNDGTGEEDIDTKYFPGHRARVKLPALDRGLDWLVRASGSAVMFFFIQVVLLVWVFLGIPFSKLEIWAIVMGDGQAIFSYVFDSFLMRQQLNNHRDFLIAVGELSSRNISQMRMLEALSRDFDFSKATLTESEEEILVDLPKETRFGQAMTTISIVVGHLGSLIFYWATIFVWLGFGPVNHWSNLWQLDLNSALSAWMVFTFSFLAIVRERHADYSEKCLDAVFNVDARLESRLRTLTGDQQDNTEVIILSPRVNVVQRGIFFYSKLVGTLVGIVILTAVFTIWLAVGPLTDFDSNWWLIIGTVAGLVGTLDGFVLRNIQMKLGHREFPEVDKIHKQDLAIAVMTKLPPINQSDTNKVSLSLRVSDAVLKVCAHELSVVVGLVFIISLIIGSSVMRWNTPGQLLCNIPPMIVESFFMQVLITGHNASDAKRRADLKAFYERRSKLLSAANGISQHRVVEARQIQVTTTSSKGWDSET